MDCRIKSGNDEILCHCNVDKCPYFSYIRFRISPDGSVAAWRHSRRARVSAVPAGGFATRSWSALGVIRLALRPGRDGLAGLGQVGAGNARSTEGPPTFPPRPRKQKPGAESLAMKDSLGREPRWNADRCAPGAPGAAGPVGTEGEPCVCRRFASESLYLFR